MSQFSRQHFAEVDIKELIHHYKQYECLWNFNIQDYKDKALKQKAWLQIANHFNKDVNEVKRKIKYLRSAYVTEKRKVAASRKSGKESTYKPMLFYFNDLDFLTNVVILRKYGNDAEECKFEFENIQISQDGEDNDEYLTYENTEDIDLKEPEINCKSEIFLERDIDASPPPQNMVNSTPKITSSQSLASRPAKRKMSGKIKLNKSFPVNSSSTSISSPQCKNLYLSFGRTISLQLQQLPLEEAILTMSEIHTVLTKKTLVHIRNLQNSHESDSEDSFTELNEETFNDSS